MSDPEKARGLTPEPRNALSRSLTARPGPTPRPAPPSEKPHLRLEWFPALYHQRYEGKVYYNLHKHTFSIQHGTSKGWVGIRRHGASDRQPQGVRGRSAGAREGRKNVHAS